MIKKKSMPKALISTFSIVAAFFSISNKASAANEIILTPENASQLGVNFEKAANALAAAGIFPTHQEIGIRFHEESTEVDLSCLDGASIIVDLDSVSAPTVNDRELGG